MAPNVKVRYKHWLISKIDTNGDYSISDIYGCLIAVLFETDFVYISDDPQLNMDKNRASDGLYLRTIFDQETGNDITTLLKEKKPSVLEVLIALSIRIEQDIMGEGNDDFGKWFVEMLENLGLTEYTDDYTWPEDEVLEILGRFMYRRYGEDGIGSLFPLKNPEICSEKFTKLEIWNQMQYYLRENYD